MRLLIYISSSFSLSHTCFNLSVYSSGLSCHTHTHSQRIINFISFNLFLLFWPFHMSKSVNEKQEAKAVKGLFLFHFITGIMINSKYITIKKKEKNNNNHRCYQWIFFFFQQYRNFDEFENIRGKRAKFNKQKGVFIIFPILNVVHIPLQ